MSPDRDVDVLVVGSGAAGLAAALSARENGAGRVLVAEAEGVVGGSSRLSGGLTMGAGTRYQRALGIADDAGSLFSDYMTLNHWDVEAGVARRLADLAGPTVEWLGDLGVEFHDQLVYGGDERVPRVHVPIGRGQAVVDVLHRACRQAGVEVALGRRVDRLLVEDGAVTGIAVGADTITAGAVVLATGGFGDDPDRLAAHYPSAAATGCAWYIGAPGSRGDALDLADQVGAQVLGHDRGLRLLHAGFAPIYEAYLPGWIVIVNREGRRFFDETAPYGITDGLLRAQGDVAYAVFDDATLIAATAAGVARYKQKIPGSTKRQSPHWNADVVEQMVAAGKVHRTDTTAELAEALGLPVDAFEGSVARHNEQVAAGEDSDYLKDPGFLEPIATPPFYGAEIRPATVCFTACGPRIDRDARVLDRAGRPVPGLFAAGECTGGVIGPAYVGSGNSYANCVVFGRVAGAAAAALVPAGAGG
ncbi:FAD-dependent oxidoreductase [Trujillonella humicola]|uniref:FAD-dependent oxidoreductase n=1 Tax=Trujillonella humicola TaxID=3383699 RepID=UPI00390683D6